MATCARDLHGRANGQRLCRRIPRSVHAAQSGGRMTRFALFYQSLVSDWNHGNAHFLRGLMRALQARGHSAICYEQSDNWSLTNLTKLNPPAVAQFKARFPDLQFEMYELLDVEAFVRARLADADVVLVNEWNEPAVVK